MEPPSWKLIGGGPMKNKITALFCLLALFYSGKEARAAEASCTATIVPAISASKNTTTETGGDLAFGVIIPSGTSGTVTIAPSTSDRTRDGGVVLVASTYGAASFNVYGGANTAFTIALPDTGSINISSGSNTMKVQRFTVYPPGAVTLDNLGQATFNIGGTLDVSADQPPGNYTGSFTVTVAYQ
jgi:hypothetical protein